MAVLKMIGPIHPRKAGNKYEGVKKLIDYALNPKKTENGLYTASMNCAKGNAYEEMISTIRFFNKEPRKENDRLAYHFMMSWREDEQITPEDALEIAKEFCEKCLGQYETVIGIHLDKSHIHAHIAFNSVNCVDGHKYRYEDGDWEKYLQPVVDELCMKKGYRSLEMDTGMELHEYKENRCRKSRKNRMGEKRHCRSNNKYENEQDTSYTWKSYIKHDIDDAILHSRNFKEFESILQQRGYVIRYGKSKKYEEYMAVKTDGMDRYRRTYALGFDYRLDQIKKRIEMKNKPLPDYPSIPQELQQGEMRYLFSARFYRVRYKGNNPVIRNQYLKMFHLGIIQKNKYINFIQAKENEKLIRKLELQINLLLKYDISDLQTAQNANADIQRQLDEKEHELKQIYVERKQYKEIIAIHHEMQELEMAYQCYLAGDMNFKQKADEYQKLKEIADTYNFSSKEIFELEEKFKVCIKNKRKEIREIKEQKMVMKDVVVLLGDSLEKEKLEMKEEKNIRAKSK